MKHDMLRTLSGNDESTTVVLGRSTCAIAARRGDVVTVMAAASIERRAGSRSEPHRSSAPDRTMLDLVRRAAAGRGPGQP